MGRQVRMVIPGWQHPKDESGGYIPLLDHYEDDATEWLEICEKDGMQAAIDWMGHSPDRKDYMPDWAGLEATHYMMYEDTTEGTPISPAFATPEELAHWLADNGASSFGSRTASYEQWLSTIKRGYAISAMIAPRRGLVSGVEFGDGE